MGAAKVYNPSLHAALGLRSTQGTTKAKLPCSFLRLDMAVFPAHLVPPVTGLLADGTTPGTSGQRFASGTTTTTLQASVSTPLPS